MTNIGGTKSWTDEQVAAVLQGAKQKLQALHNRLHEPLAVIGMGCRFPQADSPDAFWRLLDEGRCAISDTPADRWPESLRADREKQTGRMCSRKMDVSCFEGNSKSLQAHSTVEVVLFISPD